MPDMLSRINRIFRRAPEEERDNIHHNNINNNNNHMNMNNNNNNHKDNQNNYSSPIKLRGAGYERQLDGSVTLSVTLDKDQVECCVCLTSMTSKIFRCQGSAKVSHNICANCEWQMRRMKNGNGHTKGMQCPMCKVKGTFIRNRALERQLLEFSKPCLHEKIGCNHRTFPWDEPNEHALTCMYQPIDCPFCLQTVPGGRISFVEHLTKSITNHNRNGNDNNNTNISFNMSPVNELNEMGGDADNSRESEDEDEDDDDDDDEVGDSQVASPNANAIDGDHDDEMMNFNEDDQIDDDDDEDVDEDHEEKDAAVDCNNSSNSNSIISNEIPPCLLEFVQVEVSEDNAMYSQYDMYEIGREKNHFVADYDLGIVLVLIAPNLNEGHPCWRTYAISISPNHNIGGNSRIYLSHCDSTEHLNFCKNEAKMGLVAQSLYRPIMHTTVLNLARLHPTCLRVPLRSYDNFKSFTMDNNNNKATTTTATNNNNNNNIEKKKKTRNTDDIKDNDDSDGDEAMNESMTFTNLNNNGDESAENSNSDDSDDESIDLDLLEYQPQKYCGLSPVSAIQCAFIYGGNKQYGNLISKLAVRMYTLEESFKIGAVIDARDFTGKWYQAEVIRIADSSFQEYAYTQNLTCLDIRRAKIHYLGYSANYDEWLHVDTDSHRIAQRGTYTVGPDLRAVRRHSHVQQSNAHNRSRVSIQRQRVEGALRASNNNRNVNGNNNVNNNLELNNLRSHRNRRNRNQRAQRVLVNNNQQSDQEDDE